MLPDQPSRHLQRAVTDETLELFLSALAKAFSVTAAAALAGCHRQRFYELRDQDDDFRAAWEDAYEQGADVVRDEIRRRAVEGWEEPVFQQGKLVGHVRKYSDRLLELEAKRRDPAYRDSVKVEGGEPVTFVLDSLLERARTPDAIDAGEVIDGEIVDEEEPPLVEPGSSEDGAA